MVTVTDNDGGQRRRGRPRKWKLYDGYHGDVEEYWKGAANDLELADRPMLYSRRQQENIVLAFQARDRIEHAYESQDPYIEPEDHERYALGWAASEGAMRLPRTALTELGRIEDEDAFWRAAIWCETYSQRYRAHDLARVVREFRLGKRIAFPGE